MKMISIATASFLFFLLNQANAQTRTIPIPQNKLWERPVIVPLPSMVKGVKQPVISLNGVWKINPAPPAEFWKNEIDPGSWKDIPVPAQADMQGVRTETGKEFAYKTLIKIPADFNGSRIFLRFEGVTGLVKAYINGNFIRDHFGGFNVWTCDITDYAKAGDEAWLTLGITEPPEDKVSSRMDAGGIIRNVKLMAVPQDYIYRFNVETDFDGQYKNAVLKLWLGASFNKNEKGTVRLQLKDPRGKPVVINPSTIGLSKTDHENIFAIPVPNPVKWDVEHPELYTLEVSLMDGNAVTGTVSKKIGFREIELRGGKMLINGNEIKLRGAGRFDSDPIYGRYLSDEECWKEVKMLKEANMNHVRPACYPAAEAYLDACDALGLYVELENSATFTRGSQKDSSLSPIWLSQMADMIEVARSRPSVVIYELANETYYGVNIGLTYKYAKAEDPTRPVIYSWSQSVPPGEPWPYDIYSYHYPDWDIDLGKAGVAVFNSRQTRPLPQGMPILHDEFAHGSSYYQASLARDPGMRDFWGESIKRFWERMFVTENCLGGAMWAVIDDNAGGAWAFEWGAIDLWRRERPEYWHFRKAYSPVRLEESALQKIIPGKLISLPVKNWYDHTNFNELTIQWSIGAQTGRLKGPSIRPHASGNLQIPVSAWKTSDILNLKFFDRYNRLVDEYRLPAGSQQIAFDPPGGPMPSISNDGRLLVVSGKNFQIRFDTTDGLIEKGIYNGKEIITGGPYFNLIGAPVTNWKLRNFSVKPADKNYVVVTIAGSYDSLDIVYDVSIDGTGLINTEYTLGRFRLPVPMPHKIPWNVQDAGGFEEVGIYYLLNGNVDKISWKRDALWSVYPADHIGRAEGTANRYGTGPQKIFGKKPQRSWSQDERDFSVFGQYDVGGRGTNDFRSIRENIYYANAILSKDRAQVRVESNGSNAVRLEVIEGKSNWIDNNDPAVKYVGSWEVTNDSLDFHGAKEIRSTKAGDYIEYAFNGPGIAWIGSKGRVFGTADLYIDGKLEVAGINFFNRGGGPMAQAVLFSKEGLSDGPHTIKIVAKEGGFGRRQGNNNPNAQVRPVSVPLDAFRLLNGKSDSQVKLIINNLWNQTKMGLGNYMKDPILIGAQYRNNVTFRLMDIK